MYIYIEREGWSYVLLPASEGKFLNIRIHRCVYEVRVTLLLVIWAHYIRYRVNCTLSKLLVSFEDTASKFLFIKSN